jgi:F-type H+-transporting ATPase subunit alpha
MNNLLLAQNTLDETEETAAEALSTTGTVISNKDGILEIVGLDDVFTGEIIAISAGDEELTGQVINIELDKIKAVVLGDDILVKEGAVATSTGELFYAPVGKGSLGRVVNALGNPVDGGEEIEAEEFNYIEVKAPGIITRKSVHESLATGVLAIDAAISIGRGQRELIIGDRQTGKTTLIVDSIINHKGLEEDDSSKLYCIYGATGQRQSSVTNIKILLESLSAVDYTTFVAATASEPASLQYTSPYVACTLGEYYRDNQMHSLVAYDDLSKQAVAYRHVSLLLRRPPGREAYPGDVFYLHSRLLERAAKLNEDYGAGSLTALPVIETQGGDLTAYIPTNVISITDGQIFLEKELFYKGVRPAINIGLSVSRVGSAAQNPLMKEFVGSLKLELAQFREVEIFASFGSEIDATTQQIIKRGSRLVELLNQEPYKPLSLEQELTLLFAGRNGFLDDLTIEQIREFKSTVRDIFENEESALAFVNLYELDDEIVRDLTLDFAVREIVDTIRSE